MKDAVQLFRWTKFKTKEEVIQQLQARNADDPIFISVLFLLDRPKRFGWFYTLAVGGLGVLAGSLPMILSIIGV